MNQIQIQVKTKLKQCVLLQALGLSTVSTGLDVNDTNEEIYKEGQRGKFLNSL